VKVGNVLKRIVVSVVWTVSACNGFWGFWLSESIVQLSRLLSRDFHAYLLLNNVSNCDRDEWNGGIPSNFGCISILCG